MLKKNDEKINGFLWTIVFPFPLYAIPYYRSGSSLCRLQQFKKIVD